MTSATPLAVIDDGDTLSDVANISGATSDATGTVTFSVYGPDDTQCSGEEAFSSVNPIGKVGDVFTATSDPFTPTKVGTYRWVAAYSGDANNKAVSGECNDANETSIVKQGSEPALEKVADPASGGIVKKGTTITYTVTPATLVDVAIDDGVVTDILPEHVTLVPGSISNDGEYADGEIVWTLDFGPAGSSEPPSSYALTYQVTVDEDTPQGSVLINTAKFFDLTRTTTHTTSEGSLTITKANSPTGTVGEGDTIVYTMAVTVPSTATANQDGVVVTDYVPGYDPARTDSLTTTYVDGSAKCTGTILPAVRYLCRGAHQGRLRQGHGHHLGPRLDGPRSDDQRGVLRDRRRPARWGRLRDGAQRRRRQLHRLAVDPVERGVQRRRGVRGPAREGRNPGGVLAATGLLFRLDHALELAGLLLLLGAATGARHAAPQDLADHVSSYQPCCPHCA